MSNETKETPSSFRVDSAILIILVAFVAYLPVLRGGFVFDDSILITANRMVKASDGLRRFWFTTEALDYYPLTSSSWWLEWHLWGNNPMGYHVVNVLLHAANAVLVWIVLRRLRVPGAWVAGLVFAVHPVNAATGAWISEQKNTLSMLFYAVAILFYLQFYEESRWRWYGLSLAAFLLALLSKAAVVMLPVVLVGCVWWLHRTVRVKDILYSVPFFALSLVMGLVGIWFQYHRAMPMHGNPLRSDSFLARLAAAGWVPWFYLYKALLPANLMVFYPKWEINASHWISYVPGVILIGSLTLFWWKRNTWGRPLLFGLGYFLATLFPVMGFFDQGFFRYSLVADHWQYYAIVAPIALVIAAGELVCRPLGERGRYWGAVAVMALLIVLGVGTWRRSYVYADAETLWRDNVIKEPNTWMAHLNLGRALAQKGEFDEAIGQYEWVLRIKPDSDEAHNNLGNALGLKGEFDEAIGQYEQALRIKPDLAVTHFNLGGALWRVGRVRDAIAQYEETLRLDPGFIEAKENLARLRAAR
jgi:tetratricopeptide (TPR) repeat protein